MNALWCQIQRRVLRKHICPECGAMTYKLRSRTNERRELCTMCPWGTPWHTRTRKLAR